MPYGAEKTNSLHNGDQEMRRTIIASIFWLALTVTGCTGIPKGLEPVKDFEPDRYLGKWYEIARLDHSFERHLSNVSASYTRGDNGDIRVINRGFNAQTGNWKQIEGHARLLEGETVGSLKVSFFWPFYGAYHIIALDRQSYGYAMVAGPNRSYLWILARQKRLDESVYAKLVSRADDWGFDTAQLIRVEHNLPEEEMALAENTMKTDAHGKVEMLTSCPSTPNCVSSIDGDRKHFVEPLRFRGSVEEAQNRLLELLSTLKRTRVVTVEKNYIHAESVSAIFRFVDDVEFSFDDRQKVIQVKSASRVGYYDLGANRRRVEKIRNLFYERNKNGHDQ
jgi:apolipoprotein D and lipocalin family protein